ncbi:MAG: choline/carnitine O-acyltransferase [Myxococcota bacterium]
MHGLPRHPYESFETLTDRIADRYVSAPARGVFRATMRIWRKVFGVEVAERAVAQDMAAGRDGFWHDEWIHDEMFYPEISATLLGEVESGDPIRRAATLIHAAVRFMQRARAGQLGVEVHAGRPQDMRRYRHFFSRICRARVVGKGLRHRFDDLGPSDHVVVCVGGDLFALRVLEGGAPVSRSDLHCALCDAVDAHRSAGPTAEPIAGRGYRPPVGLLTTVVNQTTVRLWDRLAARNPRAVERLDSAIFFVSLDLDLGPETLDQTLSGLHIGRFEHRDFRRSLQIAIAANGAFGITVNPYAGIGGTLCARLVSELAEAVGAPEHPSSRPGRTGAPARIEPVRFVDPGFDGAALEPIRASIRERLYPAAHPTTFQIDGIGREQFEALGLSCDAAFHAALALAWHRLRGRVPTVGNFINLRSVEHGDIWRYDASTSAMADFVERPSLARFRAAERAHKALIRRHKAADDELYLCAMILKRLVCDGSVRFSGFVTLMLVMSVFIRDFQRRLVNPDLWVSGIPAYPGLRATGRGGTTLRYLGQTSIGGHYMVFADHIVICLVPGPRGRSRGAERALAEALGESLRQLTRLATPPHRDGRQDKDP